MVQEFLESRYGEPPTRPDDERGGVGNPQPEAPPVVAGHAARTFGNPVQGRIGPKGHPDPASLYVVTRWYGDGSMPQYGDHDGLDIDNGGAPGDPILAMDAGRVYQRVVDPSGALIIRIDHGGGWTTGYAHMSRFRVDQGAQVTRGQVIGDLGSTGYSTGPHVHMDTSYGNARRDPWPLLAQNQAAAGGGLWMATYGGTEYTRLTNKRYRTLPGARFRADTTTKSAVLAEFPAGTGVVPHAQVDGEVVAGSDQWALAFAYANGKWREGAFHISTLEFDGPVEAASGATPAQVDAAEKAAADKVRDAGVSALNTAAKAYGA